MKKLLALCLALICLLSAPVSIQAERLSQAQLFSYYNNSVFIGDSITAQLLVYVRERQQKDPSFFEGVKFLTAQSYFLYTASRRNLLEKMANLKYKGSEMPMCRILKDMKPTRAIILLGVNDYIGETIDKGMEYDERILDLCEEFAPDTEIIFQSLTPVTASFCHRKDYRTMWDEYNEALKKLCEKRDAGYIDIASRLKDDEGYLDEKLSSDGKYHLNPKGLQMWIDALLDYAQEQYDKGAWTPEVTK